MYDQKCDDLGSIAEISSQDMPAHLNARVSGDEEGTELKEVAFSMVPALPSEIICITCGGV